MIVCRGFAATAGDADSAGVPAAGDVAGSAAAAGCVADCMAGAVEAGDVAGRVAAGSAASARTGYWSPGNPPAPAWPAAPIGPPAPAVAGRAVTTWNVKCWSLLLYSKYFTVRKPKAQRTVSARQRAAFFAFPFCAAS